MLIGHFDNCHFNSSISLVFLICRYSLYILNMSPLSGISSVQSSRSVSDSLWPPWTAAHQASLSNTNSQSLRKLMSIKSVMPCNSLILCHPLLLLQISSFWENMSYSEFSPQVLGWEWPQEQDYPFPVPSSWRKQVPWFTEYLWYVKDFTSVKWKVKVLVAQLCPTLWAPRDCNPPGSPVYGILQARILEWVAISFLRGSSLPRDRTWVPPLQADSLPW